MTGNRWLDWAIMAVSLFNTILLLWLGLTILLNAERRTWGVWLAGGGTLLGAAFFISHTAILGSILVNNPWPLNFWWHLGWIPVILLPYVWYIIMLWYAGFWNPAPSQLRRSQLFWTLMISAMGLGLFLLMLASLPSYSQVVRFALLSSVLTYGGIPVLLFIYPIFAILCILLSIHVLRHPEPPERVMGDLARQRARPWLVAASLVLLAVTLILTWFMVWAIQRAWMGQPFLFRSDMARVVGWFDLVIASLVGVAVILLGQATISYEVFTGKTLPRRGFFRHWRNTILFAGGYSVVIGGGLMYRLQPIHSLLLTIMIMVAFFALFSWRSFVERERFMAHLRPFVDNQSLIQRLAHPGENLPARASGIFWALCRDILGAQKAQLIPLGALAPLAGPPLTYPPDSPARDVALSLDSLFASPGARFASLDPGEHGGFLWAVPLWAERGPIGVLCIGEKQDGGLYTQEEIEIAQASSERLVDGLAGEQMARCLMDLQRRRLTETQVLDRRTRRVLHDKILPDLHTTVLGLSGLAREHRGVQEAIAALTDTHRQIADLIHTLPSAVPGAPSGRHLVEALQEMMRVEFAGEFDKVTWSIIGPPTELSPLVTEVVFYAVREAVRNAALHGRGDQRERLHLALCVAHRDTLAITVEDDGVGLAYNRLEPEGKEPLSAGSHGGLALHRAMMAVIGGALVAEAPDGGGARVTITVPVSEATHLPPAGSGQSAGGSAGARNRAAR